MGEEDLFKGLKLLFFLLAAGSASAYNLTLSAVPPSVPADNASYSLLTARLTTANGTPVASAWIYFSTTLGHLNPQFAQTNWNGTAFSNLTSDVAGTATASANSTQYGVLAYAQVQFTAVPTPTPTPTPSPTPSPTPTATPTPPPALPDLVVSELYSANTTLHVGEWTGVSMTVANIGTAATGQYPEGMFFLRLLKPSGPQYYNMLPLDAGQNRSDSPFFQCLAEGEFTLSADADVFGNVTESDETNNGRSLSFTCLPPVPTPTPTPNATATPTSSATATPEGTPVPELSPFPPAASAAPPPAAFPSGTMPQFSPTPVAPPAPFIFARPSEASSQQLVPVSGVLQDRAGNPVPDARISIFNDKLELAAELKTDAGGSFSSELPEGNYTLVANSSLGSKTISVKAQAGKPSSVRIVFEAEINPQGMSQPDYYGLALLLVAAFLFLAAIVGAFKLFKAAFFKPLLPENAPLPPQKSRAEEILPTLSERERAVVEYLLKNGDKKRFSKVRFETKIPKTSFFRVIRALETRNIVRVEREANTANLFLTDWFLGKG